MSDLIMAFVSLSLTRKELRTTSNEGKYENLDLGAILRQSREVRGEDR